MARIGILGDIHANLAALEAILDALDDEACDQLVCTGDIVGYGASPAECIRLVRERQIPCVLGNHDHYVTLLMDPRLERLSKDVRASIEWTQGVLDMTDLKWLAQLPRQLDLDGISLVHGAFGPKPWLYLTNEKTVATNFAHQNAALACCGHTHIPMLAFSSGEGEPPQIGYLRKGALPEAERVIFNAGSVGQPRDHDSRAACAVLDPDARTVRPLRVPYDITATQKLMRAAGLPEPFAERLSYGR